MKAVVAAFNQEKALVGAFSVIMNLRMDLFEALVGTGLGYSQIYFGFYLRWSQQFRNTPHAFVSLYKYGVREYYRG